MKKVTITSKNITTKQWSNLILELNLMKKAWNKYAKLELHAPGIKKIIAWGTRSPDEYHDKDIILCADDRTYYLILNELNSINTELLLIRYYSSQFTFQYGHYL